MNRTYKVIWSKARRCYVVVSELAKGQHKSSSNSEQISSNVHRGGDLGKAVLAAVVASLLTFGGMAYLPVMAADYNFDSHTSINGSGGYHDPGSSDLDNFSHPDSDLTLDWTNEGKTGGISRGSGVSAIYNTPEVTAKNITVIATQKGNQWNDKGIIYNNSSNNGKITATGTIKIQTNDDCIYTNTNDHNVEISGFNKLILKATGKPSSQSSGYAIMNNGTNNFLMITGGENSEIDMTNTGKRAVVADNSSSAGSTKTSLTANTINLHANIINSKYSFVQYSIVQTAAHPLFTGGQIEINGLDKTIINNENKNDGIAVNAYAPSYATSGKSLIEINKKSKGVVEITGDVVGDNGTADIDFAGRQSFLTGDMKASGENGKILANFKGNEAKMTGDIDTTATGYDSNYNIIGNKGTVEANFTGSNASMTGDITAAGDSKVTTVFSGNKASFTGNIDTTQTSRTGSWNNLVDSPNNSAVTADFSGNGASFTGSLKAAGTSTAEISVTNQGNWKGSAHTNDKAATSVTLSNGSIWNITENSNVSAMDLSSGAVASLSGSAHSLNMGTLKASGVPGTFAMDLTYHDNDVSTYENATDSDFLYAHDGSGSTFTVQPTAIASVDTMKSGDKLYFAQVRDGAAAFTVNQNILLQNKKGLFDNKLSVNKEVDSTKTNYEDWFLTLVGDGKTPNPNAFTPGAAYNAAFALWRDDDTLLKRLGELRYNQDDQGIWARFTNKRLERDGHHGFEGNFKTLQVGLDKEKKTAHHGSWYYGGAVSHLWGNTDYEQGHGSQKATDFTFYGTNLRPQGHYLDLVARIGRIDSNYDSAYGDHGSFQNWGSSIGAEYGRKKTLRNGWSLEPQAQLTYNYLWGDDYTTRNGARVHQDNADSLVGRLGFVLGREFHEGAKNPSRVYLKASVLHDFIGDTTSRITDDLTYTDTDDLGDTWYVVGIGTNIQFADNTQFYFDAEKSFCADIDMKYRFNAGIRFEF